MTNNSEQVRNAGIMPLYHYTKASCARDILVSQNLRWSAPAKLNDPFDISQDLGINIMQLKAALAEGFIEMVKKPLPVDSVATPRAQLLFSALSKADERTQRLLIAEHLKLAEESPTKQQEDAWAMLIQEWKEFVQSLRIICFSEINDNQPMWAHYADDNRGVVLEYKGNIERDSYFILAHPVAYINESEAMAIAHEYANALIKDSLEGKSYNMMGLLTKLQYRKTQEWAYEREWRIVYPAKEVNAPYTDIQFFPEDLKSIYFGYKCSEEDIHVIRLHLSHFDKYRHIATYRTGLDISRKKLVFTLIPN